MKASDLYVFTARSNPLYWRQPHANYERFAKHMLDSGVHLVVVECAYGEEEFACNLHSGNPMFRHIGVRAKTRAWNKENLLNIGVHRTPEAKYLAWIDSDIIFRNPDWAKEAVQALQHYDVIQPWSDCYDLGPKGEHIAHHKSFCHQFFWDQPLIPKNSKWWQGDGGPYSYPHSGYSWCATRQAFDWLGGLFEMAGMGSADHHCALALVGLADYSMPQGTSAAYREAVKVWEGRALRLINKNIGYLTGTIEHLFHGRKSDRGYLSRWDMFVKYGFDPLADLKRNSFGVIEFCGNKPELRRMWDQYLLSRREDLNAAG